MHGIVHTWHARSASGKLLATSNCASSSVFPRSAGEETPPLSATFDYRRSSSCRSSSAAFDYRRAPSRADHLPRHSTIEGPHSCRSSSAAFDSRRASSCCTTSSDIDSRRASYSTSTKKVSSPFSIIH